MSWLPVLLVLLALCMVAGPILMLKPTRRQRNLAHLRARASALGLRVHLGHIEGEELGVYQLPWPSTRNFTYSGRDWCLERKGYAHEIHINDFWYWQNGVEPTAAVVEYMRLQLAALPEGVKGIAGNSQGLGCFWDERGGESAQDRIQQWLGSAREQLWPSVRTELDHEDGPAKSDSTFRNS